MPARECFRLHIDQSALPVEKLGPKQQREPCGIVEPTRFDLAFLVELQLLTQEQDLCRGEPRTNVPTTGDELPPYWRRFLRVGRSALATMYVGGMSACDPVLRMMCSQ